MTGRLINPLELLSNGALLGLLKRLPRGINQTNCLLNILPSNTIGKPQLGQSLRKSNDAQKRPWGDVLVVLLLLLVLILLSFGHIQIAYHFKETLVYGRIEGPRMGNVLLELLLSKDVLSVIAANSRHMHASDMSGQLLVSCSIGSV